MEKLFLLDYKVKKKIVEISLAAVGVMFRKLSRRCPEMKAELAAWNPGRRFTLGILPDGPAATFEYTGAEVRYIGSGVKDPDVAIYFKNIDSALLVFTGQIGAHTAAIQCRTAIHGDLVHAMQMVRAMDIVVAYLMPGFMHGPLFKRPPQMGFKEQLLKTGAMLELPVGLIFNAAK
jgi:hypothetical protein